MPLLCKDTGTQVMPNVNIQSSRLTIIIHTSVIEGFAHIKVTQV